MNKVLILIILITSILSCSKNEMNKPPLLRIDKFLNHINSETRYSYIKSQRIEMAPGIMAPIHSHPVPTFGVGNNGEIVFKVEGQKEILLKKGDTFFEPKGISILIFGNKGTDEAAFTVFYLLESENSKTTNIP